MVKKRQSFSSLEVRALTKALLFLSDLAPEIDMTTDVPFNTTVVTSQAVDQAGPGLDKVDVLNAALVAGQISPADLFKAYIKVAGDAASPIATTAYTTSTQTTTDMLQPTKFGYKKAMIEAGQEFIFNSAYIGANGDLIVRAVPVDSQPFKAVEYKATDLDIVFPSFSYDLVKKIEKENRDIANLVSRDDSTTIVFNGIFDHFILEEEAFLEKIKADEEARKREAEREMEDLPTWGMF